ncbi:alpha/beta hydrolase [Algoriphagus namhaensis]|uniref:Alpha/beta hydrolase n=1 Tax=Algoriphagus namhaensis TaxID=915353 RepID=A0ABV8AW41_9BACT
MKKILIYSIGAVFLLLAGFIIFKKISQTLDDKRLEERLAQMESTASPNVQILSKAIPIDAQDQNRTIAVYLPANYDADTLHYSVLYFLDGQFLFDQKIFGGTEWQLDEVMDSLGDRPQEQSIIVGLYHSDNRGQEYKPLPSSEWFSDNSFSGDQHAKWIVEQVKPWIDQRYRTKKDPQSTVIGGASFGGLMSYFMLMKYPDTFGSAVVLSPSFWVNDEVYTLHLENENLLDQKIYFNAGELEPSTIQNMEKMKETLLNHGVPESNIRSNVVKGLGHSHSAWRLGFRDAYPWIIQADK